MKLPYSKPKDSASVSDEVYSDEQLTRSLNQSDSQRL